MAIPLLERFAILGYAHRIKSVQNPMKHSYASKPSSFQFTLTELTSVTEYKEYTSYQRVNSYQTKPFNSYI